MGALIEVSGLGYRYPDGAEGVRNVGFAVRAGERVAVLGPNGSGKSTLLLHLNGLLLPTRGAVRVADLPVSEDTAPAIRRKVGFVFQEPDDQLFLPTVLEDVAFGPLNAGRSPGEAEERARAELRELGLEDQADRAAHHLSGGERRLASLATVLVSDPEILVLDEPTAALDARARRRVVDILRGRTETLVVATHDLEVAAALCPRALVLDAGNLVADLATTELLGDPDLLERHGLSAPLA
jgi:cobalt/nickel transport system ATP-binding protein